MSRNLLIDVDDQELATILAALRTYQEAGYGEPAMRPDRIHQLATNGEAVISLNDKAIDKLCEHINECDRLAVSPTTTKGNQQHEEVKRRGRK